MRATLIIIALLLSPATWSASWGQIRHTGVLHVATEGDFRPFNYMEGTEVAGFEVDLVNAIAKKLRLKTEWTAQPFDGLISGVSAHRFDLVAASHAITPERAKSIEFINPHYCTGAVIITHKGGPTSLSALSGKTVGATEGTTYFARLKPMARFKELKGFSDDAGAIQALSSGLIDAWVTDRFVGVALVKSPKGAAFDLGDVMFPEMVAMAVAKGDVELRDRINGALATLLRDGTYEKLSYHYFNADVRCRHLSRKARSGATGN